MIVLFLLILFFSSCTFPSDITLSCHIALEHPYEQALGRLMWYRLVYFDGEEVVAKFLPAGERTFTIKVKSGGLRPIIVIPLDTLSPIGGYYEEGEDLDVELYSEEGSFFKMLLEAAKQRPDAISQLSVRNLLSSGYNLSTIDQSSFLEMVLEGKLTQDKIKNAPYFHPELEGIPTGYWISDSVRVDSFYQRGSEKIKFDVFSGVYSFWNMDRNLLLSVVIAEDGRYYTTMNRVADLS